MRAPLPLPDPVESPDPLDAGQPPAADILWRFVYPADPFELIPTVTPRPNGGRRRSVPPAERKPPPWVRVLDRPKRTFRVVTVLTVMILFAGSAAGAGLPGTSGRDGDLPPVAWIAPELAAPDREEPRPIPSARPDPPASLSVGASGRGSAALTTSLSVGESERASVPSAPGTANAPTLRRSDVAAAPAVSPAEPTSLRDRLAQRSYKNESTYGQAPAPTRPAGHTAAYAGAIRLIESMARAKAGRPSRPIGGYQDDGARIEDPSELPAKGYGWYFSPWVLNRKTNFGTDPMVFGLMEVFAVMADLHPDGLAVRMEDIGRAEGGKLDPHISHRTGRDADLSLFGRDDKGKAVNPRVRYDGKGNGGDGLRFDTARNWDFACAMIECTRFDVHFLLIDQPLKDLLLAHGRERAAKARTDAERERQDRLVARAGSLLRDGGPGHANHYHLRIK